MRYGPDAGPPTNRQTLLNLIPGDANFLTAIFAALHAHLGSAGAIFHARRPKRKQSNAAGRPGRRRHPGKTGPKARPLCPEIR